MEVLNTELKIECNGELKNEMYTGLPKLVEMKLPRLPKEKSSFGQDDEMYAKAENLLRNHIDIWKEKGMNLFYSDHGNPKDKTHVEFCMNEPMKVLGFMDDFDDEYIYCRVFDNKLDCIKDEYRMCACFGGVKVKDKVIPNSFIRMEFRDPNSHNVK